MPFNGSGTYTFPSLPGSWNPAISGQQATPNDWNTLASDLTANGLSNTICKDGQTTVTADIGFANFRLKLVGAATLSTDAPNLGQIQSGAGVYALDTGTADLYAIAPSPVISAYAVGQMFRWKAAHTNVTTTPTLAVNGLTAGIISWPAGTALAAGDLPANGIVQVVVNTVTTGTPTFQLLTRAVADINQSTTAPTVQSFTSGTAQTYTTPVGTKWIKVRIVGAGGGGGGAGATTNPTGATGGTTTFNAITALGGVGGIGGAALTNGDGGAGGSGGTGGTIRFPGGSGVPAVVNATNTGASGQGGTSIFGGAGSASAVNVATGGAGGANTGSGGGGGTGQVGSAGSSGGGGAGEYVEFIIGNPSATYTYTVGAGGAGGIGTGSGASTGGAGAAGFITVEEHYNF